MEERNELNDIILNKGNGSNSNNKKIILAIATLGIVLIIVVLLMNTLTSSDTNNLPQAVLPPEPQTSSPNAIDDEPLFEEVEVVQEDEEQESELDIIAQKLKEESEQEQIDPPVQEKVQPKQSPKVVSEKKVVPIVKQMPKIAPRSQVKAPKDIFIQVGSFTKYEPNPKFLKLITKQGYSYKFYKVTKNSKVLNKVVIGPFESDKEARKELRKIRSTIEAGAFIVKI